jgi:hypothetical protein
MLRPPGPTCTLRTAYDLKDGTSCLTVSPKPGVAGRFPTTPALPRANGGLAFVAGSPQEEAKSLLRPCLPHGEYVAHPSSRSDYGMPLPKLPQFLDQNVGTAVTLALAQFQTYLKNSGISENALGGPLTSSLPDARYFVIHDTSYKYDNSLTSFPAKINTTAWVHNRLKVLKTKKDAHVFISRLGESNTAHDFSLPFSATKYTNIGNSPAAKQLKSKFCHVEMIQPRLGKPGNAKSDWMAPTPGFTPPQLDRLALVYIAASLRHGEWLVPAYHHNVDMGFDAHDDPQNFDLEDWSNRVGQIVKDIRNPKKPGDFSLGTGFGNAG